MSRKCKFTLMA